MIPTNWIHPLREKLQYFIQILVIVNVKQSDAITCYHTTYATIYIPIQSF